MMMMIRDNTRPCHDVRILLREKSLDDTNPGILVSVNDCLVWRLRITEPPPESFKRGNFLVLL